MREEIINYEKESEFRKLYCKINFGNQINEKHELVYKRCMVIFL